jgi:hypothetical protein
VPGKTTVDGKPGKWNGKELRITQLPAKVEVAAP